MKWMSPGELLGIKVRHAHVEEHGWEVAPPGREYLTEPARISLANSVGAHEDRGRLLEVVEAILAKQS